MNRSPGPTWRHGLLVLVLLGGTVVALQGMDRSWWCETGDRAAWSEDTLSIHNSQHLFDPYTFTHVLHGMGFYAILWLLLRRWVPPASRWVIAIGLESFWEVIENTSAVIEKYRESTIALGYYGDSILNSVGDIAACAAGYALAMYLPFWGSLAGFFLVEALLVWWIRDSLLLNILMLLWPLDGVRTWQQMGG